MGGQRALDTLRMTGAIGGGGWSVDVSPAGGGAVTVVVSNVFSEAVTVPADRVAGLAGALRTGGAFYYHSGAAGVALVIGATPLHNLSLSAATAMTWQDGQYPTVWIGPDAAGRLAALVEAAAGVDPLSAARRRTDENLRSAFG